MERRYSVVAIAGGRVVRVVSESLTIGEAEATLQCCERIGTPGEARAIIRDPAPARPAALFGRRAQTCKMN